MHLRNTAGCCAAEQRGAKSKRGKGLQHGAATRFDMRFRQNVSDNDEICLTLLGTGEFPTAARCLRFKERGELPVTPRMQSERCEHAQGKLLQTTTALV